MRRTSANIDDFVNIRTPEMSYVLGLLWADGFLTKPTKTSRSKAIGILANKQDLLEVKLLFDLVGQWGIYERKTEKRQDRLHFQITSFKLWEVFKYYEFDKKSYVSPTKVLSNIPDHLKHYWFRGYFDGDGHIKVGKNSGTVVFTGSYEQDFSFVKDTLSNLGIGYTERAFSSAHGSFKQIIFSRKENIKKFYSYIYKGKNFGFSRKRNKFESLPIINGR